MRKVEILLCVIIIIVVIILIWKVWSFEGCHSCKVPRFPVQGILDDNVQQRNLLASFCSKETMKEVDDFISNFGPHWPTTIGIKNYTKLARQLELEGTAQIGTQIYYEIELYCHKLQTREDLTKWYSLFRKLYPKAEFDLNLVTENIEFVSYEIPVNYLSETVITKLNMYETTNKYPNFYHAVERTLTPSKYEYRGETIMGIYRGQDPRLTEACKILGVDPVFVRKIVNSVPKMSGISLSKKEGKFGVYITNMDLGLYLNCLKNYMYPDSLSKFFLKTMYEDDIKYPLEMGFYFQDGETDFRPLRTALYTNFHNFTPK